MIKIPYQNIDGGVVLKRELTPDELKYTSKAIDGTHVTLYYGDEPAKGSDPEAPVPDIIDQLTDEQLLKAITRLKSLGAL